MHLQNLDYPQLKVQVLYFAMYNVQFFAQIFEEKIRMFIVHGWDSVSI